MGIHHDSPRRLTHDPKAFAHPELFHGPSPAHPLGLGLNASSQRGHPNLHWVHADLASDAPSTLPSQCDPHTCLLVYVFDDLPAWEVSLPGPGACLPSLSVEDAGTCCQPPHSLESLFADCPGCRERPHPGSRLFLYSPSPVTTSCVRLQKPSLLVLRATLTSQPISRIFHKVS